MVSIVEEFHILHLEVRGLMDKIDAMGPEHYEYQRLRKILLQDMNRLLGMIHKVDTQIDAEYLMGVKDGILRSIDIYTGGR